MNNFINYDWKAIMDKIASGVQVDFGLEDTDSHAPVCADCDNMGYVRYAVNYDDPRFGKMFRCPNPDCPIVNAQRIEQSEKIIEREKQSWQDDYGDMTLEGFKQYAESLNALEGKRGAFAVAFAFATKNGEPFTLDDASMMAWGKKWPKSDSRLSNSVVLSSDVGLGKTSLAISCVNHLHYLGKLATFARAMDVIKSIQSTYGGGGAGDTTPDRYRFYTTIPFLALDEFGIKNYSPDRLEIIETIIRSRDRSKLPTLITTNLTLEQIDDTEEGWGKQIGDIVKKSHWVSLGGVKLRQTARKVAEIW